MGKIKITVNENVPDSCCDNYDGFGPCRHLQQCPYDPNLYDCFLFGTVLKLKNGTFRRNHLCKQNERNNEIT